ncbi:competence type IV pilus minor pilin ComGD [Bacillus sp. LL01]|uniref:competence type IV pilus minor pilin ComGD n=1 Tax=Bacillus sp. LL01 TaxID=1665556 RepID=UPI000FFEEFD5|nr:competence type IV pilus minor pilin ComGD [Bacillus sp. LL01]
MSRYNSTGGHTLLESLLVLSIVSVILSVTVLKLSTTQEKHIGDQFSEQLSNDLLFAQQYALSTKSSVYIIFTPKENYYRIRQGTFQINELVHRDYHPTIRIDTRTMGERITYHGNGSITKSGAIGIYVDGKEYYQYVFTLGKGRFYVERL